jgi:carboxypeptidase C (cathepsin A)
MKALSLLAWLVSAPLLLSQNPDPAPAEGGAKPKDAAEKKEDDKGKDSKEQKPKTTKGRVAINGQEISYVAKTGTLPLLKEDGSPRATVFFVYYAAVDAAGEPLAKKDQARPITYCFNGGPGSSAVWLHFGGLGPKKIDLPPDGRSPETTGKISDNPLSIMDATDLVFIDPVGTGGSRPAKGEKGEQFWGVEEDIEACAEFIRLFTTREERWMSPKYLCGESYGGLRGAGLCDYLQEKHGMMVSGFICVSGVLNFATLSPGAGNDLPYMTFLPALTATAHYHGKLAGNLDALLAEARSFAFGEYAVALLKGQVLPEAERQRVAEKVARFTSLAVQQVLDNDLRIDPSTFREWLLRKEGKIVGRFDGRVVAEDGDRSSNRPEFDPSFSFIIGPFSAMANAYTRSTLGFESDQPYRVLTPLPWNYTRYAGKYAGTDTAMAGAMKSNPRLRVLVCAGLRDLAVPFDATRYSFDHLLIPQSLRKNIVYATYESGHMMYMLDKDARKLREDMVAFLRAAQ